MSVARFLLTGNIADFLVQPTTFYTRFKNNVNFCWANSIIQALASLPPIVQLVNATPVDKIKNVGLQTLFYIIKIAAQKHTSIVGININREQLLQFENPLIYRNGDLFDSMEFLQKILENSSVLKTLFTINILTGEEILNNMSDDEPETPYENIIGGDLSGDYIQLNHTFSENEKISEILSMKTVHYNRINQVIELKQIIELPKVLLIHITTADLNTNIELTIEENLNFPDIRYSLYAIVCFLKEKEHYISYCKRNSMWFLFDDKDKLIVPPLSDTPIDMEPLYDKNSICKKIPNFQMVNEAVRNKPMILFYVQNE